MKLEQSKSTQDFAAIIPWGNLNSSVASKSAWWHHCYCGNDDVIMRSCG